MNRLYTGTYNQDKPLPDKSENIAAQASLSFFDRAVVPTLGVIALVTATTVIHSWRATSKNSDNIELILDWAKEINSETDDYVLQEDLRHYVERTEWLQVRLPWTGWMDEIDFRIQEIEAELSALTKPAPRKSTWEI